MVYQAGDADSLAIADAYCEARNVPSANRLAVNCPYLNNAPANNFANDVTPWITFYNNLYLPVRAALATKPHVEFVVMCRGVSQSTQCYTSLSFPYGDFGFNREGFVSIDALLTHPNLPVDVEQLIPFQWNRFNVPTSRWCQAYTGGRRIVTRLDGFTQADALGLISRSLAALPEDGLFFGQDTETFDTHGDLRATLAGRGLTVEYTSTYDYQVRSGLMFYSNYGQYQSGGAQGDAGRAKVTSLGWKPGGVWHTGNSHGLLRQRPNCPRQLGFLEFDHHQAFDAISLRGDATLPATCTVCSKYEPYAEFFDIRLFVNLWTQGYSFGEAGRRAIFQRPGGFGQSAIHDTQVVLIGDPLLAPYAYRKGIQ